MREIAIAGRPGATIQGAPYQAEALAYFARMTTPPSAAFRDALNWAIWRWKAIGAWSQIKGLWILAADTAQASLLSTIGDTPRDAVIVGAAPTFTALKGYSGFDVGKQIRFPITSAILASDSVFAFAALLAAGGGDGDPNIGPMIQCDLGSEYDRPGNFTWGRDGGFDATYGVRGPCVQRPWAKSYVVGGTKGTTVITPGVVGNFGGGVNSRGSNYTTTATATPALQRLCAYGFLDAAASTVLCRKFTAVLAEALDMIGALD